MKKDKTLTVSPCVTLEYCLPNSGFWVEHSRHDDLKNAIEIRKRVCADEANRRINSLWRIIEWSGKVQSVLPALFA